MHSSNNSIISFGFPDVIPARVSMWEEVLPHITPSSY